MPNEELPNAKPQNQPVRNGGPVAPMPASRAQKTPSVASKPVSSARSQHPGLVAPKQAPPVGSRATKRDPRPTVPSQMSPGKSSSQAGLAALRTGASMSAPMAPAPRVPGARSNAPKRAEPAPRTPQAPDLIDRVPSQDELAARSKAESEAGRGGFESQEGESTTGATARGFTEGLSGTLNGGQALAGMHKSAAQESPETSAVENRLEKRPWLKEIVDQEDQTEASSPEQDGGLER